MFGRRSLVRILSLTPFLSLFGAAPAPKAEVPLLRCSFCGKNQREVKKLIAGPSVYICNECVALCNEIIAADDGKPGPTTLPKK